MESKKIIQVATSGVLASLLVLTPAAVTQAAAPSTSLAFQGQLSSGGSVVNGSKAVSFRFYGDVSGGSALGSVISKTVQVSNGYFNTTFTQGDLAGVDLNQALWIEVTVDGDVLSPRLSINAVPSALATFGIYSYSTEPSVGAAGSLYYNTSDSKTYVSDGSAWVELGGSQWVTSGSDVYYTAGNVGIGTTTPNSKLVVGGQIVGNNFVATAAATSSFAGPVSFATHCITADTRFRRRRSKAASDADADTDTDTEDTEEVTFSDLVVGDVIESFDEETNSVVFRTILALYVMGVKPIVRIDTTDGHSIKTTDEHPYYAKKALEDAPSWIKVKDLEVGNHVAVVRNVDRSVYFDTISALTHLPEQEVFDLSIDGTHTFIANDIVAHNTYMQGGVGVGVFNTSAGTLAIKQAGTNAVIIGDVTGDVRGTGAVDVQSGRTDSFQVASGNYSSALGYRNTASGYFSSALGYLNTSSGTRSSASGAENTASGDYSTASGYLNTASGNYSSAFGSRNTASGYRSSASGAYNTASGTLSSASGAYNIASGCSSSALGIYNIASGCFSSALGACNTASGNRASALGNNNTASGYKSSASGYLNTSSGNHASALGYLNTASGCRSSALGFYNNASGQYSSALGLSNTASGNYSSASGYVNTASGNYSSASGYLNTASGDRASSLGNNNTASGTFSSASGYSNTASGCRSSAFGNRNTALGNMSSASGYSNTASAGYSSASGYQNTASGFYSTALGYCNNALGGSSSALGYQSSASGDGSTASGYYNIASGTFSSAFGYKNNAPECKSSAWGYCNTASGTFSSASGYSNTASGCFSSALGAFNTASGNYSSALGLGNSSSGYRSSALGFNNAACGEASSALGFDNIALLYGSTASGYSNNASGGSSTASGYNNTASGVSSSALGFNNTASGNNSSAIGYLNTASGCLSSSFGSCINNSVTNSAQIGVNSGWLRILSTGQVDASNGACLTAGGTWTNTSDRNLKENFQDVDRADILAKINALPLTQWNYKTEDASVMHIGPMAQDFYAAFNLGGSETSISTIDPSGIALVGVQALSEKIDNLYVDLGLASSTPESEEGLLAWIKALGVTVKDGVAHFANVIIGKISVSNLTIKNEEDVRKTGYVIYDRATGNPICVFFENGVQKTEPGECVDENVETQSTSEELPEEPVADEGDTEQPQNESAPEPETQPVPEPVVEENVNEEADMVPDEEVVVETEESASEEPTEPQE